MSTRCYGTSKSWGTFAQCIATRLGITEVQEVMRIMFNNEVKKALKSHAWKKASSIIVKRIRYLAGKKGASWIVKKLARKLLPGGAVGELALGFAFCGAKEAWNWIRS